MQECDFLEVLGDVIFQCAELWLFSYAKNCPKMINLGGNTHLQTRKMNDSGVTCARTVDSGLEEESASL